MTAKMARRVKTHRVMSDAKVVAVKGFCDDQSTFNVSNSVPATHFAHCSLAFLILCSFVFRSILRNDVDNATSYLRRLEETKAEITLPAHEASARDDRGAFEMSQTTEISYNSIIVSRSDGSLKYSFIFPDGDSDASFDPRKRPWYRVKAHWITEDILDLLKTFASRMNETANIPSFSDGEHGCTKSFGEELVLEPFDYSDKSQDFKVFYGTEIRTEHDNIESANRVQTGSISESFANGSEITTGPSHQENWIPRPEYHHFLNFIIFYTNLTTVTVLTIVVLSDLLRALRRSSHGWRVAWMESSMRATHGFKSDQSTPLQTEMPDDATDMMGPLLRDQIKIALEPVLGPVTAALLHQGREERKQRQKLIAMEEHKLALKKEEVRRLKRRRACRFQLTRRALATKSSRNNPA